MVSVGLLVEPATILLFIVHVGHARTNLVPSGSTAHHMRGSRYEEKHGGSRYSSRNPVIQRRFSPP